ncbi:MAG: adenylate/guanylate cyclase domain-containing protein [Termitinemataceae bacterium]|nr:MAG: adenylate/guanylate cyclase domain-containing protein [Termitinemataceae bacterium]
MGSPLKVKYPIMLKLVFIVTALLAASLGTMTVLISVLISKDVQLTAETNNFSINRRIAESVGNELKNIRNSVSSFLNDLTLIETRTNQAQWTPVDFFFAHQSAISGIALLPAEGERRFIMPQNALVSIENMNSWLETQNAGIEQSRSGETLLRNASPFLGIAQLVMLLPVSITKNHETIEYTAAVFISPDSINKILVQGINTSFLLNDAATVLAHPDEVLVLGGANFYNIPFVSNALKSSSEDGAQTVYTDEDGNKYFGMYKWLNLTNSLLITIIKQEDVFADIAATTRRNIFISAAVLLFSILVISIFAFSMSRPLIALTGAAKRIEEGDYNLNLKVKTRDEIGELTKSFIGMGLGLENFEKFTNKAIVRLARRGKLRRGGQNKNITVAFILIRDFNGLSAHMSAGQIISFINEYLELMVPCIVSTGGIVDKFLTQGGVIIMAVWGSAGGPAKPDKTALRCICSLLMIRATLVDYNNELQRRFWGYAPKIKIGCGVNSGEVVAGQMGSEKRMEYTVIGDTVNLAARLEGANDVFDTDILISENTWNLIKTRILVQEMPNIEVKGKLKPLRVFSVINLRTLKAASKLFEEVAKLRGEAPKEAGNYWMRSMEEVRTLWEN